MSLKLNKNYYFVGNLVKLSLWLKKFVVFLDLIQGSFTFTQENIMLRVIYTVLLLSVL